MIPSIAIVGRPNVGKSTLFNRLTRSRDAIVADFSGLTRDRQYGEGQIGERPFIVIDTGGIAEQDGVVDELMSQQSLLAMDEAEIVFFMVDGRAGLTAADEAIAKHLRMLDKTIHLVVNKTDGVDPDVACSDFYGLGFTELHTIAASHGRGVNHLITEVLAAFPEPEAIPESEELEKGIKLAIVGRPNVGKSTLVNRMLGEDRVVVFDMPGTTRDSIFIPLERRGQQYTLIDTAGVRRRGKVRETVEKFSVIKALQAIEQANVVVVVIDAREGVTEQDLHMIGFVIDAGKSMVLAINKWDGMDAEEKDKVKSELQRRLVFLDFVKWHFISALHGSGVGDIFASVNAAYKSATKPLSTPELSRILEEAVKVHQPPLVRGRRIKLRYAHAGGHNPPVIVIHGNQTKDLPSSYQRYLMNLFRKKLNLIGTPIRLQLRSSDNPYKDKKTTLSARQQQKKRRLMKHVKKKSK